VAKAKEKGPDVTLTGPMTFKKNDPTGVAFSLDDSKMLDIASVRIVDEPVLPADFAPERYEVTGTWTIELNFTKKKEDK
jgi:hypothetical protein